MKNTTFYWVTESGLKIFAQIWEPTVPSNGPVICLVHGLGEHSSRYVELPSILVRNGYKLISFDLRGHGKSEGKRGHIASYNDFMTDISKLITEAKQFFPESDLFLYGHSMGGNLVLNYALKYKPLIKGVIVTGPWLKLTNPPTAAMINIAKLIDKIWPAFRTHNGLRSEDFSYNQEKKENAIKDELMHPWISIHTFLELDLAGGWALEHAHEFAYPLLILHGSADKVTSPEGSMEFHKKAGKISTLKIIDDLYHEIHNEPRNDEIFSIILEWLDSRKCD